MAIFWWTANKKYIYIIEHYLAVKNIEDMKFAGKCMQMETIILSEITQT